ncbi:3,5-dihydroxyphenylacetyl-CoA synthase [subsurface metagenome]
MNRPKIISLGYAIPEHSYSQDEIFQHLGYPSKFKRVFTSADIDRRYFCIPLEQITKLSWQEQEEEYQKRATELSKQAVINCLDNRDPKGISCIVYGSCTGFAPGPTIAHYLSKELGFPPSTYYTNIIGQGCESGFPNLKRAYDFVVATGKQALVVNCELSCLTYFPEPDGKPDPGNHWELLRSNAIFADAASSALVGFDDDPRHPFIVDTETYTDTSYLGDLGYTWRDGRLRVLLSRRVPEIAGKLVGIVVPKLLERHGLKPTDIEHYIIHAAGNTVLDNIRRALGLSEENMALSRETLRRFGNTSSTSVGITGKRLMEKHKPRPGDYAAVISLGPGMTSGATLLRWEI